MSPKCSCKRCPHQDVPEEIFLNLLKLLNEWWVMEHHAMQFYNGFGFISFIDPESSTSSPLELLRISAPGTKATSISDDLVVLAATCLYVVSIKKLARAAIGTNWHRRALLSNIQSMASSSSSSSCLATVFDDGGDGGGDDDCC